VPPVPDVEADVELVAADTVEDVVVDDPSDVSR
jgi:hypothetical protein